MILQKNWERSDTTKTISVDGKTYECRRYTLQELQELFDGKVVVLDEAVIKNLDLVSRVLLDVCDTKTKNKVMEKYLLEGNSYTFWDFSPEPLLR